MHTAEQIVIAGFYAKIETTVAGLRQISQLFNSLVLKIVDSRIAADGSHPRKMLMNKIGNLHEPFVRQYERVGTL